jgi:nitrogen fixation/metabolism regulation signal transduction histidine kinase
VEAGGETGRLVDAFNTMVTRIDEQSRRLVDAERIATWREIARYLAHEIKNPLLPIRLTAQELRDQYRGDDAKFKEFLDESTRVIGDEVEHLTRLVREFSAFAKMPQLSLAEASLRQLCEDVARMYPQIDATLDVDVPPFYFDIDQMRRVFVNLFDNVVAVTEGGGRGGEVEVRITARRVGGNVEIAFADKGPGMRHDRRGE